VAIVLFFKKLKEKEYVKKGWSSKAWACLGLGNHDNHFTPASHSWRLVVTL